jgi:hypothetical protein
MDAGTWKRNRDWLDEHKDEYPHLCYTKKASPRPEHVKARLPDMDFICAPLVKITEWRFMSFADLSSFKQVYVTIDNRS